MYPLARNVDATVLNLALVTSWPIIFKQIYVCMGQKHYRWQAATSNFEGRLNIRYVADKYNLGLLRLLSKTVWVYIKVISWDKTK